MFNKEILAYELKPQYLEFVVQDKDGDLYVPLSLASFLSTNIGDKYIYDVPLSEVSGLEDEIDSLIERRVYVALAFLHSGEGVYVVDEDGEHLNSYPRGDKQIWVRKNKFFIVCPKGEAFYITGWDFSVYRPYCQNILALYYKANAVPCNLNCFKAMKKE